MLKIKMMIAVVLRVLFFNIIIEIIIYLIKLIFNLNILKTNFLIIIFKFN